MRRLPVLPTLVVAAAVATMIGLGIWQLQRAGEKERLLAQYSAAASLPALDLDPLLARDGPLPPLAFRRVLVTCDARVAEPELRGGRSRAGAGGYSYLLPCRPGAEGLAGRLRVNAGWSAMPDDERRLTLQGVVAGTLGQVREEGPIILTSATAAPPLAPSAAPAADDIPNNHIFYAFQWFFFAAAAALIYVLALRRRLSGGR
jgi:surfeit locus 1 family protein